MKNWTVKEALAVVAAGNDIEAIKELAKHFPNFFLCAAKGDFAGIANAMPDKWTLRTLEKGFGAQEEEAREAEEVEGEEAVEAEEAEVDLAAMSTKELMKLCDKRGIKVPHYGKNKQFYLDALTGGGEAEAEAEAEEAAEAEAPANPYEGKTAMELFKLCKQRKIKAEAKQKAKYYVELLAAADQAAEAESEEAAEQWDEEEEEVEEKPTKKSKGGKKAKSTKKEKEAPKAEPEDDEDDWDI